MNHFLPTFLPSCYHGYHPVKGGGVCQCARNYLKLKLLDKLPQYTFNKQDSNHHPQSLNPINVLNYMTCVTIGTNPI